MRTLLSSLLVSISALALTPLPADVALRGFFPQSVQAQRDLETRSRGWRQLVEAAAGIPNREWVIRCA